MMRETLEFRIPESRAKRVLPDDVGETLAGSVRVVRIGVTDPLAATIALVDSQLRARGEALFTAWNVQRRYSQRELDEAELLYVRPQKPIEPAAEECGTVYDDSHSCDFCGAGGVMRAPIRFDVSRLPRSRDIAVTIANEWLISARLADHLDEVRITGAEFARIEDVATQKESAEWRLLNATGTPVEVSHTTRFGENPLDERHPPEGACPLGHVAGLNVLSEIHIARESWGGDDITTTKTLVGVRLGLLRPHPMMLVSQKVRRALAEFDVRGLTYEVVRLHDRSQDTNLSSL